MNRQKGKRFQTRFIDQLFIGGIIVLLLGLSVTLLIYSRSYRSSQTEITAASLHNLNLTDQELFYAYIESRMDELRFLAKTPDAYALDYDKLSETFVNNAGTIDFHHIFVVDANGEGHYFDDNLIKDQSREEYFSLLKEEEEYISEPFHAEDTTFITLSTPIFNKDGKIQAYLCGAVGLESICGIIEKHVIYPDAVCVIVDGEGKYISSQNFEEVRNGDSIFGLDGDLSKLKQAMEAGENYEGQVYLNRQEYLLDMVCLEHYNWYIVTYVPNVALVGSFQFFRYMGYLVGILTVLLVIAVLRVILQWRRTLQRFHTDALTGVNSRAALDAFVHSNNHREQLEQLTIYYLDLNHFKYINDTYGHEKGDELLHIFANTLCQAFGPEAQIFRQGGDEFVVAEYYAKDPEGNCRKLNELLAARSEELGIDDYVIRSAYGYVNGALEEVTTMHRMIGLADKRMYDRKEKMEDEGRKDNA